MSLAQVCKVLSRELDLDASLNLAETVHAACDQLGVPESQGNLMQRATFCYEFIGAPSV